MPLCSTIVIPPSENLFSSFGTTYRSSLNTPSTVAAADAGATSLPATSAVLSTYSCQHNRQLQIKELELNQNYLKKQMQLRFDGVLVVSLARGLMDEREDMVEVLNFELMEEIA
ncbi:hypothetical protein O3P69_003708 [Scylla paramamosain]|uniref:Uncharacterized protein n=1 Tax=Scylla paramamosain TaxID=85552 RepID=A0AAW0UCX9_SCYPA